MNRIYLDYNATAPLEEAVREAMRAVLEKHGPSNPSSLHAEGRAARRALENAREEVAEVLGAEADEIVFTSGASEANATALAGLARARPGPLAHTAIEHPSLIAAAERASSSRREVLRVDGDGRLDLEHLEEVLNAGAELVSVMGANNEVGTLQDLAVVGALSEGRGAWLHSDLTQVLGKAPLSLEHPGLVAASFSAHKIGGPPGIGALWIARDTPLQALIGGGSQERGRRAGTENLLGATGFAAACRLLAEEGERRRERLAAAESDFLEGLRREGLSPQVHGPATPARLSGTLSLRFPGVPGESLLFALDLEGVAIGLGAACSSGAARPSRVLQACGIPKTENLESVRVSLGWRHQEGELREAARRFATVISRIRAAST